MSEIVVGSSKARSSVVNVDVAIIGAGPAGLTAGYLLTKQGFSVAIIEKDETYVGGISRTVEHEGYRFDIGGHRFFSKSQQVVDLWNEILPDDFIQRPRMSRIYYEGKFYSYPLRCPVSAHFIAGHAPDLLGVSLEVDRIEFVPELVDGPVFEALHSLVGEGLGFGKADHAQRGADDP